MALKAFKCESCGTEFTMDDDGIEEEDDALTCPQCGEDIPLVDDGEDEDDD